MKHYLFLPSLRQRATALFLAGNLFFTATSCALADAESRPQVVQEAQKIKIALLLDTSNSMDGLIDQAKAQLWTLVNELAKARSGNADQKPELQIALYEYGNDRLTPAEGYIRMVTPLTNDLDKVSADLFGLSTNGGSEFCGHVIQTSLKQLDWDATGKDLQIIFIAGNEGFNQGGVDYKKACLNARDNKVVVNTIYCGAFNQGVNEYWKDGADLTNGTYMSIEQDRKTVYIDSPYDKDIMKLNSQLNDTYIYYGNKGYEKKQMQEAQDKNASSYGAGNAVNRAVSKSKHVYKAESWDLVDAKKEGKADLKKVDKKTLPAPMQSMGEEEMEKYVETKSKEREKIKTQIDELNKKREAFVKEKQKQAPAAEQSLNGAMLKSIQNQAKAKNMQFE
jgi:hypothetical protein